MTRFNVGDVVTLSNTFAVSGTATDPTTVSLAVTDPAGTTTTYTYAAAEITRNGTGVYSKAITASTAGVWSYVWTGTGTAPDVQDGTFTVWATTGLSLYVGIDEMKSALGISSSTTDDAELELAANASSRAVDALCRRVFYPATSATARTFYPLDRCILNVDDIHTTTGLVVKTDDGDDGTFETTWSSTDYQLEPRNGIVDGISGWPYTQIVAVEGRYWPTLSRRAPVEITAKWGWAAPPQAVRQATLIKAMRLFKRKDSPQGVAGFGEFGVVRITNREDADVAMLLAPYVKQSVLVG